MFTVSFNDDGSPIGYLTLEQFAKKFHANVGTIRTYSIQGKIPGVIRICGKVYVSEDVDILDLQYGKKPKGRRIKVKCLDTGKVYESITDAAKDTGCYISAIVECARYRRTTAGGKRWRYAEDDERRIGK